MAAAPGRGRRPPPRGFGYREGHYRLAETARGCVLERAGERRNRFEVLEASPDPERLRAFLLRLLGG